MLSSLYFPLSSLSGSTSKGLCRSAVSSALGPGQSFALQPWADFHPCRGVTKLCQVA